MFVPGVFYDCHAGCITIVYDRNAACITILKYA